MSRQPKSIVDAFRYFLGEVFLNFVDIADHMHDVKFETDEPTLGDKLIEVLTNVAPIAMVLAEKYIATQAAKGATAKAEAPPPAAPVQEPEEPVPPPPGVCSSRIPCSTCSACEAAFGSFFEEVERIKVEAQRRAEAARPPAYEEGPLNAAIRQAANREADICEIIGLCCDLDTRVGFPLASGGVIAYQTVSREVLTAHLAGLTDADVRSARIVVRERYLATNPPKADSATAPSTPT